MGIPARPHPTGNNLYATLAVALSAMARGFLRDSLSALPPRRLRFPRTCTKRFTLGSGFADVKIHRSWILRRVRMVNGFRGLRVFGSQ